MLINVMVTPGDVQDRDAIAPLLEIASNRFATLKKAIADGAYQGNQRTAEAVQFWRPQSQTRSLEGQPYFKCAGIQG